MAITLSAAVGPSTNPFPITGGPVPGTMPIMAQLESEQVLITSNGTTSVLVTRGYNGTAASSHASGVTLTPVPVAVAGYPLYAPTGWIAETMPRQSCPEVNTVVSTTTQIAMQAIWLQAGMVIKISPSVRLQPPRTLRGTTASRSTPSRALCAAPRPTRPRRHGARTPR